MKIKDLSQEELEAMSYDDIAFMVLTESKKKLKINELFKKVCDLLKLSEQEFIDKLPSFFDVLSTDRRFIMVEKGLWDLKSNHSTKVILDTDDEDDIEDIEEITDDETNDESEEDIDIYREEDETDDIDTDDDLKDLVIIDEEDEASGM